MGIKTLLLQVVRHQSQRYNTVGDWNQDRRDPDQWYISVSRMDDWHSEVLVMVHELVEMALALHAGISEGDVTEWDKQHPDADEPGEVPGAPYYFPHVVATQIERTLATAFGLNWVDHEANCARVSNTWDRTGGKRVEVDPPILPKTPF